MSNIWSDPRENHRVVISTNEDREVDLTVVDADGQKKVIGTAKVSKDGHISGNITDSNYAGLVSAWRPGDFSIGLPDEDDIRRRGDAIVRRNVFDEGDQLG